MSGKLQAIIRIGEPTGENDRLDLEEFDSSYKNPDFPLQMLQSADVQISSGSWEI